MPFVEYILKASLSYIQNFELFSLFIDLEGWGLCKLARKSNFTYNVFHLELLISGLFHGLLLETESLSVFNLNVGGNIVIWAP
jgi:hypothetical protein